MGKFCFEKVCDPYIQNDQRVMGIILRYVCWGTHRPPPPPRGARQLTVRPANLQGLGQPRGGGFPPLQPPKGLHAPGVTHWLAAAPVVDTHECIAGCILLGYTPVCCRHARHIPITPLCTPCYIPLSTSLCSRHTC